MSAYHTTAYHRDGTYSAPLYSVCRQATRTFDCYQNHVYIDKVPGATVTIAGSKGEHKGEIVQLHYSLDGRERDQALVRWHESGNETVWALKDLDALPDGIEFELGI